MKRTFGLVEVVLVLLGGGVLRQELGKQLRGDFRIVEHDVEDLLALFGARGKLVEEVQQHEARLDELRLVVDLLPDGECSEKLSNLIIRSAETIQGLFFIN